MRAGYVVSASTCFITVYVDKTMSAKRTAVVKADLTDAADMACTLARPVQWRQGDCRDLLSRTLTRSHGRWIVGRRATHMATQAVAAGKPALLPSAALRQMTKYSSSCCHMEANIDRHDTVIDTGLYDFDSILIHLLVLEYVPVAG